jgi:CRP-like cAMP-binding protein
VPVTAKLSKLFYDRLGEEIANELVEWFNQVDATYRSDLREVNELNFARFDAKLEQRFAQFDAKLEQRLSGIDSRITQLASDLRTEIAQSRAEMERRLGDQTRWMFLCWATLLASNIALWMR